MLMANHSSNSSSTTPYVNFDNLYPAILQCFVIILFGYVAGRTGIISITQGKGIGTFVSKFCLPALLFQSMCELKFSQVNWIFLGSILIAKTGVFFAVFCATIVVKRPLNLGCAGLYAIFCTQSNDFALGYPILQALYNDSHPEYLQYIYLIAPISLVFLNPIGFVFMEVHKNKKHHKHSTGVVFLHVFKGIVSNPIVFMTAIGIAGNFIFKQTVPYVIGDILKVLGNAFSATALFYLGLNLVGKLKGQLGIGLVVPILLIATKSILLPLFTWEVIGWLETGQSFNQSESLGMYGFLYGTFPSAPSVFLYASQYGIAQDTIATSMVAGTFISAPLMFVSAKMMTVVVSSELDYKSLLLDTSFDTSILGIICCLWVLGVLIASGRWKGIPHRFLLCLIISQLAACLGMVIYSKSNSQMLWQNYVQFIVLLFGVFGSRCWTAMIAVALCMLHTRSLCYILKNQVWMFFYGFGLPVFLTGFLFLIGRNNLSSEIDPSFHYGYHQTYDDIMFFITTLLSAIMLFINIVIVIVALTIKQRNDQLIGDYAALSLSHEKSDENADENEKKGASNKDIDIINEAQRKSPNHKTYNSCNTIPKVPSIEDILPFPKSNSTSSFTDATSDDGGDEHPLFDTLNERTCLIQKCGPTQRRQCITNLRKYMVASASINDDPQIETSSTPNDALLKEYQSSNHFVLVLLLLLSMLVGLFLCVWKLFNTHPTGIYIEIEFLDGVFNYGQGFLTFAVFGFDTRLIFSKVVRRIRRWLYGVEMVQLPDMSDLDDETVQICKQFTEYHQENCAKMIVKDLRYRLRMYKDVFTGKALCDWLINVGLAKDRLEAIEYGRHLTMGRTLAHVTGEHFFHDLPYFYRFISNEPKYSTC
ncbi:hypothetical protein SNE40_022961 [Patella caerulea]|uniref:DEP domain-containing protein n=1 Tax=Patella caerulea TaxID=87958 RepID=A0AAN8GG29_PATCE